jgi:hypothetical protein
LTDGWKIVINFQICKSQHIQAKCLQILCADPVIFDQTRFIVMLASVQFNHQPRLGAVKVYDIAADNALTIPLRPSCAQKIIPQMPFLGRRLVAHLRRAGTKFFVAR